VTDDGTRRVRSPADVLRLVVAAIALLALVLVEWPFGDTLVAFTSDLLRGLDALPDWLLTSTVVATRTLTIVVLVGGLAWTLRRHRWAAAVTAVLAATLAALLTVVLSDLVDTDHGSTVAVPGGDLGALTSGWFPTAVGFVLTRTLVSAISFGSLQAVLIGWFAGAAALVILGAPARRADAASISAGLAAVGFPLASIEPASVDARGSTPYFAVTSDGCRLFVGAHNPLDVTAGLGTGMAVGGVVAVFVR
jgi:undecaprenyl-diphosphatase